MRTIERYRLHRRRSAQRTLRAVRRPPAATRLAGDGHHPLPSHSQLPLISTPPLAIIPSMDTNIVSSSADVMGGTPVFSGTRVPIQTFLDYIEAGETIDEFLEGFPTVTRKQVIAFLEEAKRRMTG